MLLESGDLIPVKRAAADIPWTRRKTQVLGFLHRGPVEFSTFVYGWSIIFLIFILYLPICLCVVVESLGGDLLDGLVRVECDVRGDVMHGGFRVVLNSLEVESLFCCLNYLIYLDISRETN